MKKIAIIQSTGANFASLQYAFDRLGTEVIVTDDKEIIKNASHVVLPGVGSAKFGMNNLGELVDIVKSLTQPVLGICLGMQLLANFSEEGEVPCIGIVPSTVRKLKAAGLIVPHMGWNSLTIQRSDPILNGITNENFYFVHSYAMEVSEWTLAVCEYGTNWSAVVRKDNFYGVQFHPEKSGEIGMRLMKNFLECSNDCVSRD
ncbi:MAG: imidazole glycerol phosphate synthase subunit HisH [Gammaproteobacteria bacterium]